ncbi:hypothetical protein GBA52_014151 [Prunus armeniaca]|nr:hypothetical protein GBA52_014151 [Prunus armeniaca]
MALHLLSNILSCFSEAPQTQSKRYICDGDVCVLRNQKQLRGTKSTKNKRRHSLMKISFARLSMKRSQSFSAQQHKL